MPSSGALKGPFLLLAAAPAEAAAVAAAFNASPPQHDWQPVDLSPGWTLARTGVGKANAAACAAILCAPSAQSARSTKLVLNLGVCGILPGPHPLDLGSVVIASSSIYADEGLQTLAGFQDMGALGFGPWPGAGKDGCSHIDADAGLASHAHTTLKLHVASRMPIVLGPIATVSTCSGTDALAAEIARRTGAIAEAMEGAAIAHVLHRLAGPPMLEIRVASNTTGDRDRQRWDLKGALARLTEVVKALREGSV